jgi:cholesterol oxidase
LGDGYDYDVLVVGSGFGGSTTALRLTEKGYTVGVLESGRRYTEETFPKTNWDLRSFAWFPHLGMRGMQRITILRDVAILSACGVGGGSLVYANTLYEPLDAFYRDPQWAGITDWKRELAPYYAQAKRMLGVTEVPADTPADEVFRRAARRLGVEHTFHRTEVGVFFGEPGKTVPDPYFGGEGPARTGCTHCGACMVGCRHGAKNTLTKNYLYLAEKHGAVVHPERKAVDLVPLPEGGWEVVTIRPGSWLRRDRRSFRARKVVLSAAVLGSLKLLWRLKQERLPSISDRLGALVRTNSEAILGASAKDADRVDFSKGVAITSSIHPDEHTHIEPVRYPAGSNAMGLLMTILVDGGGRWPRWMRFLARALRHPVGFFHATSIRRWSERTIILLVMQTHDNSLNVVRRRGPFGGGWLASRQGHGEPNPTYIPIANEAARIVAEEIDGVPGSSWSEVLADIPTTAHIIGGAAIGESRERGVIDSYHRVYGAPDLYVADGSAISANLGVNPSLTITAMSERAASFWPNRGEPDPRPPLGAPYRPVAPVPPRHPAVPAHAPAALRLVAGSANRQGSNDNRGGLP